MKLIDYFPVGKDSVQENYKKLINFTTSNVLQSVYLFAFCWETFFMRGLPKVFVEKDVGKSITFWFCFTSLRDWSRKLAPLSPPIRFKTKTDCDLVARVFPRFRQFACFCFEFSLALRDIFTYHD